MSIAIAIIAIVAVACSISVCTAMSLLSSFWALFYFWRDSRYLVVLLWSGFGIGSLERWTMLIG
jgi:hypothetical protein